MLRFFICAVHRVGRSVNLLSLLAVATSLVLPGQHAWADLVLYDPLDYEQPTVSVPTVPMDGQSGGIAYGTATWDTSWTANPAGYMVSKLNRVETSGGYEDHYIERQFTHNLAPGTETWFSGIMWRPGEGGYSINYNFPDIGTALEIYNNKLRTRLGGTYSSPTANELIATNTDHRVVGRLEFDAIGNQERLTLWLDPQSPTDAPLIQQTADIGATDIGNKVQIFADSQTNGYKRWDDLRIGTSYADVVPTPATDGLLLAEYFAYTDGSLLHGQNGGYAAGGSSWDAAWTDHGLGGTDGGGNSRDFRAQDHGAEMTQSGGLARAIERQFTAAAEPGQSMYLSFILSKPDTEGGFNIATSLPDLQTSLGINSINSTESYYRAEFGGEIGQAPTLIAPNAPDRLIGRIEFNVDGTNQERLTLWVNPTFESDNPVLQLTDDIGADTIGNLVELNYNVGSDGTKRWEDLRIGTDFQSTNSLRVDIGPNGQQVEEGYLRWDVGTNGDNDATISRFFRQLGGVTITLESGDLETSGDGLDIRQRASAGGALDALKTDAVKEVDGVRMIFEGLERGLYELTTFHHDSASAGDQTTLYLNGATDPLASVWMSQGNANPVSITYLIESNSLGYAEVLLDGGEAFLNGFELTALASVPEPSSLLLVLLGGLGLVIRRGRLRR